MKQHPVTPTPGSPLPATTGGAADPAGKLAGTVLRLQRIGPGADLPSATAMLRLLDDVERARAARIADAEQSALFVAGRYLLRVLVADLLGTRARDLLSDFECPACRPNGVPDHGRPAYLLHRVRVPLALSLSRAGGFVLLGALGTDGTLETVGTLEPAVSHEKTGRADPSLSADPPGPAGSAAIVGPHETSTPPGAGSGVRPGLGVDLTAVAAVDFGGFDDVVLTPGERTMVDGLPPDDRRAVRARLWARKEALVKSWGTGFTDRGPDAVEVLQERGVTDLTSIGGEALGPLGLVAAVAVAPRGADRAPTSTPAGPPARPGTRSGSGRRASEGG